MNRMSRFLLTTAFNVVFIVSLVFSISCSKRETVVLPAHAHNDYEHENPLSDALEYRFKSIEADVFLADDSMFVAHDSVDIRPGRTLRRLYLEPLRRRIAGNGGSVYGEGTELFLFVDVKSEASSTYELLHRILEEYRDMLTHCRDGAVVNGAVRIIVSGNRPLKLMREQSLRYAFYDGRLNELDSGPDVSLMPVISDNWNNFFSWQGEGEMPENEQQQLASLLQKARQKGYIIRFWATPDRGGRARTAVWTELKKQQIGLIGTDDLQGLKAFLTGNN
ncbi:MAG: phosphatidylinositol-specific phospholipase C/glycerophosphodiester phosphodiesterase family protein [Prolixibacteraceae bacterium]